MNNMIITATGLDNPITYDNINCLNNVKRGSDTLDRPTTITTTTERETSKGLLAQPLLKTASAELLCSASSVLECAAHFIPTKTRYVNYVKLYMIDFFK